MNYLAHLYLSECSKSALLGNLMGDFVKGKNWQAYPEDIQHGIWLHRQIDKFTDAHPVVRRSKQRINKNRARYAGVLVDVFYDHFLAINWSRYSGVEFQQQLSQWIELLEDTSAYNVPHRMQATLRGITQGGMLHSYESRYGIEYALGRISARIRFRNSLAEGIADLNSCYRDLDRDFNCFFPEIIAYVDEVTEKS